MPDLNRNPRFAGGVRPRRITTSCCTRTRTEEVGLYRPALLVPGLQQRKKVESNHRPVDRPPLAGEVRPTAHIFQRKVEESNPQALPWHGFLDRLPTTGRYLPKLFPEDSNLDRLVQSQVTCR